MTLRFPLIALGLGLVGITAACGLPTSEAFAQASRSAQSPWNCTLELSEHRGATTIRGLVNAEQAVSGSYRLSINARGAGGSSQISQSGDFEARPGRPAELGSTTLDGSPRNFHAEIELFVGGQRHICSEARI